MLKQELNPREISVNQLRKAAHQALVNALIDRGIDVWADCAWRLMARAEKPFVLQSALAHIVRQEWEVVLKLMKHIKGTNNPFNEPHRGQPHT